MKKLSEILLLLFMSFMFSVALADDRSDDDSSDDDSRDEQRRGLSQQAVRELRDAGVDKYLGQFEPIASSYVGDGWTKHTFDSKFGLAGPEGPVCIAGTDYSVFTRKGKKNKLLIFEQGGGACWRDFYNCNVFSEAQEPPTARVGIWDFDSKDNPFRDYSIVYMPYCDGSVFTGDNAVIDPVWQSFTGVPARFHFGLRNQSAGMNVAKKMFPKAKRITVAGSSAGGVGAAGFAPFLARLLYGNKVKLTVFNDAGPITSNLDATGDIAARAADWDFGKFYPASCTTCSDMGQSTEIVKWRLQNDSTIREAFYETDADETNRFFLDLLFDPVGFRNLIVSEHGLINMLYPKRYKRFIVAGDTSHTALQTPLLYTQDANGTLLNEWTNAFLKGKKKKWKDIVEDPVFP
jgi:hypothetical protein